MSRVNLYMEAWNDAGRRVPIGGRAANDAGGVWINTDTADGERDIRVIGEVCGPGLRYQDRRLKSGPGDQREAHFDIELPKPGHCKVRLMRHGGRLAGLLRTGALLCAFKGIVEEQENPERAEKCMEFSRETLEMLEAQAKDVSVLPDVELPGGVSLVYALACVTMCEANLPPKEEE